MQVKLRRSKTPMAQKVAKKKRDGRRRSPCPVACALDVLGDRWTFLIVRDLLHGRSRFKEFMSSPESPPTNILTERLNRLVRHGLVRRAPAQDGSKHQAYELTQKGEDLRPIVQTLRDWGLRWIPRTEARMTGRYQAVSG